MFLPEASAEPSLEARRFERPGFEMAIYSDARKRAAFRIVEQVRTGGQFNGHCGFRLPPVARFVVGFRVSVVGRPYGLLAGHLAHCLALAAVAFSRERLRRG